ncbi:MAG: ParB/RepB/Spo0J family partition protein [Isosphaeraceae bacterium]|nr:ParB/RepB/Spo0J family partition protein [Isosphaeraceae bacterium]
MGKADNLLRAMGGTITESASHRAAPAAMPATAAAPTLAPDRLAGVTRSKTALEIPIAKIEPDPDQPREEFDEDALRRLADSIGTRGVLQPIRVRWEEGRGRYVIIVGERRWRASQMAGLAALPCVVDDRPATAGELLAVQMIENCLREDLKPVEQAKAFRALMDLNGWSGNQLAKELGVSQSGVVQTLALLELPAPVQSAVDNGELPASTAYEISKVEDPEAQAELAAWVSAKGLTRSETAAAVRQVAVSRKGRPKGKGAGRPKKITERTLRYPFARVTVELRKGDGLEAILNALRLAVGDVEAELAGKAQEAA